MSKAVLTYFLATVFASALICPVMAQGGPPSTASTAQDYEARAQTAIDAKDYAAALADIENAIRQEPNAETHYAHLIDLCRKFHIFEPSLDFVHQSITAAVGKPAPALVGCAVWLEASWADDLKASNNLTEATLHDHNAYLASEGYQTHVEGLMLSRLSGDYRLLRRYREALAYANRCHQLATQSKDQKLAALALGNDAVIFLETGAYGQAIDYGLQAAKACEDAGDLTGEAQMLGLAAGASARAGRFDDELAYQTRAFKVAQNTNVPTLDSAAANLAAAYAHQSEYDQAIPLYEQVIKSTEESQSWNACADALSKLAGVYASLDRDDQAIPLLRKAIEYAGKAGNFESAVLDTLTLATELDRTHDISGAQAVLADALSAARSRRDKHLEAAALSGLASTYAYQHDYTQAIKLLRSALATDSSFPPTQISGASLLGTYYGAVKDRRSAATWYEKSIEAARRYGDPSGDILSSLALSRVLASQGRVDDAIAAITEPMLEYPTVSTDATPSLFAMLMDLEAQRGRPALATAYGKLAIDEFQSIRHSLRAFDEQTQDLALVHITPTYRRLAALLIQQNRLAEALQVYDLMKRKEFEEYTTSKDTAAWTIPLTSVEKSILQRRQKLVDEIAGKEQTARDLRERQREANLGVGRFDNHDRQSLSRAENEAKAARANFAQFMKGLDAQFSGPSANATAADAQTALSKRAAQFGPGTVLLYTLTVEDRYYVVAVNAASHEWASSRTSSTALDEKIQAFHDALQDPTVDVTKPANELYGIIVKPIEPFLARTKATRLLWSLDGALRYCPISALYDGKRYLIERYACEEFTVEKRNPAAGVGSADTEALGLGVTKPHPGFEALPNVALELGSLIHDPDNPNSGGLLDGVTMLDDKFTRASMVAALESGRYRTVHIASHFDFQPGDDSKSFLLLGDGDKFSLADMKAMPGLFKNVDMLTLSACDTAVGSTASDGREIDGCAIIAQRDGANTVVASLWPIADASTSQLMRLFYALHRDHPELSKSEALREAQLALLHGTATAPANSTRIPHTRGGSTQSNDDEIENLPDFQADDSKPFAHPYYWAPFVLISQWQ
jgi:CHAT domain-containing protein